jgi:hypothetical protein
MAVTPPLGRRAMLVIGTLPALVLVLVLLMARHQPESTSFLASRTSGGAKATTVTLRAAWCSACKCWSTPPSAAPPASPPWPGSDASARSAARCSAAPCRQPGSIPLRLLGVHRHRRPSARPRYPSRQAVPMR